MQRYLQYRGNEWQVYDERRYQRLGESMGGPNYFIPIIFSLTAGAIERSPPPLVIPVRT